MQFDEAKIAAAGEFLSPENLLSYVRSLTLSGNVTAVSRIGRAFSGLISADAPERPEFMRMVASADESRLRGEGSQMGEGDSVN